MKKRAIFATFASLALAGVMCVGFAACGGETAESITGEEVTAEQWAAAFENEDIYTNFKLNVSGETVLEMKLPTGVDTTSDVKISGTQSGEIIYADSKTYGKNSTTVSISGLPDEFKAMVDEMLGGAKEGTTETEYYVDESADPAKYIVKEDGKWTSVEDDTYSYASGLQTLENALYVAQVIETDFEDFEYSAHFKGYVAKGTAEDAEEYTVIKFKDGKLKAIFSKSTESGDGGSQSITVSYVITYDGQSVTVPTVSE